MPTRITQFENAQQMEVAVSGPGGANRMFVFTGIALRLGGLQAFNNTMTDTWTFLLGPRLAHRQFVQAIASASLASFNLFGDPAQAADAGWEVVSADADWDDESGQVEVRVELRVRFSRPNSFASISAIGYHVTILAEVAEG